MLYSLRQIAQKLKRSPSTLQHHKDPYAEFLQPRQTEGSKHPQYEERAVEIFEIILAETKKGTTREDIKELLIERGFQPIYDGESGETNDAPETQPTIDRRTIDEQRSTIVERSIISAQESAKFTHSLLLEVSDQNELLKIKDERIFKFKQKLKDKSQELKDQKRESAARIAELEQELKHERAEYDKLEGKKIVIISRKRGE